MDAAIAGILCVGVVKPHSSGIGGGALATVYDTYVCVRVCVRVYVCHALLRHKLKEWVTHRENIV